MGAGMETRAKRPAMTGEKVRMGVVEVKAMARREEAAMTGAAQGVGCATVPTLGEKGRKRPPDGGQA